MLRSLPVGVKMLVPGDRGRFEDRYAAMLARLDEVVPGMRFGDDDGAIWLEDAAGVRLYGFEPEEHNVRLYGLLRRRLPANLDLAHFRLAMDYVTRWIYPHMRPDLGPEGFRPDQLRAMHPQHRDWIAQIADPGARSRLMEAFRPKPTDVVIDCGPFLGVGSVRMGRDVPQGRVVAVEASSDCHAYLVRNVEANGATNVTARWNGVWKESGELRLEKTYAQANSLVQQVVQGDGYETVPTRAIDEIVAEEGLERVDMLSLTLNGAEVEAIEGAQRTLDQHRPRIRAAGWYVRDGRRIADILAERLAPHAYDIFVGPTGNFMALPRDRA